MLSAVSLWAVIFAAAGGWLAGFGYYTVLAETWAAALGTSTDHLQRERVANSGTLLGWAPFVIIFLAELIMAGVLASLLVHMQVTTLRGGAITGAMTWLGLVATTMAVTNMLGDRRIMLTVIDGGHWLLVLVLMGAVLGALG